jgi:phospholipid/cholesterol/gamma-HCH transport system permease protein
MGELIAFLGQACIALVGLILHPQRLRFGEIVRHIERVGVNAIPIVSLIAFLISVVLTYQSAEQLRPLGAQQFTVNLIAISVLREMGVLLTAIMVAGRSGSAFTAEIGVMKVREEVDALKAIGVDPFEMLVMPRLLAIMIALPILTLIANLMGLLGGAVLCNLLIDITFEQFFDRVHDVTTHSHVFLVGMVKAPVFALFIGLVSCMHGMQVSGSAESVGSKTTTSVVQSIFLVLMLDAIFSIFFQQIGI